MNCKHSGDKVEDSFSKKLDDILGITHTNCPYVKPCPVESQSKKPSYRLYYKRYQKIESGIRELKNSSKSWRVSSLLKINNYEIIHFY